MYFMHLMHIMHLAVRWAALLGLAWVMTGCATRGLDKNAKTLDLSKESVVIFSFDMSSTYQPDPASHKLGVALSRRADTGSPAALTGFPRTAVPGSGSGFAITDQALEPGPYVIKALVGSVGLGDLRFTVDAALDVAPNSVVYGGHFKLRHKERVDQEDQTAGPVVGNRVGLLGAAISLAVQAATGMTGGTLEVELEDRYDEVVALLRSEYPSLGGVQVLRAPIAQMSLDRNLMQSPKKVIRLAMAKPEEAAPTLPTSPTLPTVQAVSAADAPAAVEGSAGAGASPVPAAK